MAWKEWGSSGRADHLQTDRLRQANRTARKRLEVPPYDVARAKSIAGITIADDTQVGDWALTPAQSHEIARLLHARLDAEHYDWFLEPYALPAEAIHT